MDAFLLARLANIRWWSWRAGDEGGGGARVVWLILGYVAPRQLQLGREMEATHGREIKIEACQMPHCHGRGVRVLRVSVHGSMSGPPAYQKASLCQNFPQKGRETRKGLRLKIKSGVKAQLRPVVGWCCEATRAEGSQRLVPPRPPS
jgi:hypothetical protein